MNQYVESFSIAAPVLNLTIEQGEALLEQVKAEAQKQNLAYAGGVGPTDAWQLAQLGLAVIVDVRSNEERVFVGQVPDTLAVAWASGTSLNRNPRFTRELESKVDKDQPILLLCRSGKRSVLAAEAATKAGFKQAFNILEGFEGDLDASQQRGHHNGWRKAGLPWVQG